MPRPTTKPYIIKYETGAGVSRTKCSYRNLGKDSAARYGRDLQRTDSFYRITRFLITIGFNVDSLMPAVQKFFTKKK